MLKLVISKPGIILNIPEIGFNQTRSPVVSNLKSRDINTLVDRLYAGGVYDFTIVSKLDLDKPVVVVPPQIENKPSATDERLHNIEKLLEKILNNPIIISQTIESESSGKKTKKKKLDESVPDFIPAINSSDLTFSGEVEKSSNDNNAADLMESVRKIKELTKT